MPSQAKVQRLTRVILADPTKTLRSGPGYEVQGDPLARLEQELAAYKYIKVPEIPTFTGAHPASSTTELR